ncbi:MAG: YcgL domain-containing protein [Rhodanobacter sp.]
MLCFVYASLRKVDAYLWLAQRDAFDVLPESLILMLGELRFVMEVQLDEHRKLPLEDTRQVLEHLRKQRWHLQLPPQETLATANHLPYTHSPHDDRDDLVDD